MIANSNRNSDKNSSNTKRLRHSLQIEIAVVFSLIISVLGVVLVWYNYSENKQVALIAADDVFGRVTRSSSANIQRIYAPAEALVDLTTKLEWVDRTDYSGRQALLHYFAESLLLAKHISSIYIGYADGEFYMLRAVRDSDKVRELYNAPMGTHWIVNSIEKNDAGEAIQTFYFHDASLNKIGSTKPKVAQYDPRQRSWFSLAVESDKQITSGFYRFFESGDIGTTVAQRTADGRAVIGADLTLQEIRRNLANERITKSSQLMLIGAEGLVIVHDNAPTNIKPPSTDTQSPFVLLKDLDSPVFKALHTQYLANAKLGQLRFTVGSQNWLGSVTQLPVRSGAKVYFVAMAPQDELLADINRVRDQSILISIILLLLALIIAWWVSKRISHSLRVLSAEAQRIRQLKLDTPITVNSRISEVDDLASTMSVMQSSIQQFVEISKALSAEKDFERLLEQILENAREVCHSDGGSILLFDDETLLAECSIIQNVQTATFYGGTHDDKVPYEAIVCRASDDISVKEGVESAVLRQGQVVVVEDINTDDRFDFTHARQRYEHQGYSCRSLLYLPLRNRQQEIIGLLELVNARDQVSNEIVGFVPEVVSYVQALSSQAAISLDNRRLLKAQKDLLDSFIQLIAGAIDAKSPYTSGHCQRVPELARMLAEAAHKASDGPFKDFALSDDEWYELYIASWLHDCGKVTTPEHVVDKAVKLECIYNRLHEIRMRFEVLWRDEQISYYKYLAQSDTDKAALDKKLNARFSQLQEDYKFIAECNEGGEFMAEEKIERLKLVGAQTWLRHFDDRVGLSHDELVRKQSMPESQLPVEEYLLADKQEHIVPRDDGGKPFGDNPYGFRIDVPEHAYNYGELYNLSVARGTLSEEDRFKINEHIIQTIILLNKLPFPKELRRVPTWAGNHHEKLDGTGYPRKLNADDLSIPERIMAIADIFEALTASDRPYKKAKTLSDSIRIMSFMRNDGHVCPELFDLFLTSGVYREYAEEFLSAEQINDVDVTDYVNSTKP
ncbi:HD domain-containing phosphohydrolase [Kaarinaea lacus]